MLILGEKAGEEKLTSLYEVTKASTGRARIQTTAFAFKAHVLFPQTATDN